LVTSRPRAWTMHRGKMAKGSTPRNSFKHHILKEGAQPPIHSMYRSGLFPPLRFICPPCFSGFRSLTRCPSTSPPPALSTNSANRSRPEFLALHCPDSKFLILCMVSPPIRTTALSSRRYFSPSTGRMRTSHLPNDVQGNNLWHILRQKGNPS